MDSISRTRAHNVDDDVVLLLDIWTDGGICLNGNEKFDKGKKLLKRKSRGVRGSILEYFTKEVLITFYRFDPITEWISPSIISILIRLTDKMFKKNWDWPKTQALLILNSLRGEPCLKYSCYVLFNHTCHIRKSLCYPAQIMSPWDFLLSILLERFLKTIRFMRFILWIKFTTVIKT